MKKYIKDLTPETVIKRLRQGEVLTADTGKTVELLNGLLVAKDAGDCYNCEYGHGHNMICRYCGKEQGR